MNTNTSLRRQLLFSLLATLVVSLLAGAYATYRMAREESGESFDYQLRQIALSLHGGDFKGAVTASDPEEDGDFVIQVFHRNGGRIYLSHPTSALPPPRTMGYGHLSRGDDTWRVYAETYEGRIYEVAQRMSDRDELAAGAALQAVAPFLVLLPVMGLLVWLIVGRGLAPLERITRWVGERRPDDLAPLPGSGVPQEVQPLVTALNDLLARLDQALQAQRAFVADAAHELRTPLAALNLQAQLLGRADGDEERREAQAELQAGLRRATRVVEQLLILARNEPGGEERPPQPVNLAELARNVTARHLPLAEAKGIDLGIAQADDGAVVAGDVVTLETLLSNLVENAVRYTPGGGRVDVSAMRDTTGARLEVADTGPGIPAAERERVFDRFYRQLGTVEPGSGLGLAIVRTIARRHDATVTLLDNPGGGLRVRVAFTASP